MVLLLAAATAWTSGCGDDGSSADDAGGADDGTAADATDGLPDGAPDETPDEAGDGVPDGMPDDAEDGDGASSACEGFCEAVAAAGCEQGPTEADCLARCSTAEASCAAEQAALEGCAADPAAIGCDAMGFPIVTGCEAAHVAVMACVDDDPCAVVCEAELAAACPGGPPSYPACALMCRSISAECGAETAALLSCVGATPEVECATSDFGIDFTGCTSQFAAVLDCAARDPCGTFCPQVVAAHCPYGPPDLDTCLDGCIGGAFGGCIPELHDLSDCAGAAPAVTCDGTTGAPRVVGCETETATFQACMGA